MCLNCFVTVNKALVDKKSWLYYKYLFFTLAFVTNVTFSDAICNKYDTNIGGKKITHGPVETKTGLKKILYIFKTAIYTDLHFLENIS